ncbi:FMN-dependent NADH-azoreductase 2 [Pelagimonas phthalicica]|uniref:FMN dependent NADH:quinone oxidoreductase n=1 Tax=Pelagimonas phthalicica TaxID=1037362 RepID=A0A238JI30_9RHOB|nr:NAD(P)H-dependent oxidoreductase [Pelagimonas phthalicica]TDS92415.1 FMN-dependent NADH-azoreductase [Pelagimonas phthalicica]SMX29476.1 FMN-dependent NADH-azoreductase 2 [Pelagimonas phthalicica]
MTKILNIVASPRGDASQSSKLAQAYLEAATRKDPSLIVDTIELWKEDLPEFDGDKAAAKMTFFGVGEMGASQQSAWDQVVAITSRFMDADIYVLSVPMWNGGVPYKLKQYIDTITQPGLLFGFDPEAGYSGLLEGKKAVVFYTAGVWAPGADKKYGSDFQSEYLAWWLDFVGVKDVKDVRFQPSLLTADPERDQEAAIAKAIDLTRDIT